MNSRNDTEFDADVLFVDVPSDGDAADPLELFESESDPDPSQEGNPAPLESKEALPPPASLTRVRRPMALDQVLHRLGTVAWVEAVAIVEGLCAVLISGDRERVPEMSRIAITAVGGVVVSNGGIKDAPGPILARMLHTLAVRGRCRRRCDFSSQGGRRRATSTRSRSSRRNSDTLLVPTARASFRLYTKEPWRLRRSGPRLDKKLPSRSRQYVGCRRETPASCTPLRQRSSCLAWC